MVVVVVVVVVVVETKFLLKAKGYACWKRVVSYLAFVLLFDGSARIRGRLITKQIGGTPPRILRSRLSAVHFLCFKRIFSAQVWRCYSILGSSCVLVERSGVFFVSLELSSRRRAPFGFFLTFLVFVVWCPIAVFFAPVR